MRKIIATYLAVVFFVALGSFGVTALLHARELKDPMQLTEIIYSSNRKVAIIDDRLLMVGDRIRDAKLVKLTRRSAHLVRDGKVISLNLDQDFSAIRKNAVGSTEAWSKIIKQSADRVRALGPASLEAKE